MRNYLNVTYPNRWIGIGGPVPWPARSPDLTLLWSSMKSMVHVTQVTSEEDLIARVMCVKLSTADVGSAMT